MIIKKLILKNIFQHSHREIVFSRGMNSFVGPNGSGKSNILNALCFALTGENPLPGKRSDMIQNGFERGDIILEFEHGSVLGVVRMTLKRNYPCVWDEQRVKVEKAKELIAQASDDPSVEITQEMLLLNEFSPRETISVTMAWGDVHCRNLTEYQEWIQQQLGVTPKTLMSSYFPCQGDIDSMISDDGEHRRRVLYEKANVGLCSHIWQVLGKYVNSVPDVSLIDERVETAKKDYESLLQRRESVQKSIEQCSLPQVSVDDLLREQAELKSYLADMTQRSSLVQSIQELDETINKLTKNLQDVTEKGTRLSSVRSALVPAYEHASNMLSQYAVWKKNEQRREELKQHIESIKQSFQEDEDLPEPPSETDVQQLAARIHLCEQEVHRLTKFLSTFETGICPTCGSVVSDSEKIASMKSELRRYEIELKTLVPEKQKLDQLVKEYQAKKKQIESARAAREALLYKYEGELVGISAVETQSFNQDDMKRAEEIVAQFSSVENDLQSCRSLYAQIAHQLQAAQTSREALDKQLRLLNSKHPSSYSLSYDEAVQRLQVVSAEIDRFRKEADLYRALQTERAVVEARLSDAKQRYDELLDQQRKARRLKSLRSILHETRELFHEDSLPAQVASWYANQLIHQAADYLKMFDVAFTVSMTSDFRCVALFPGKVIPVSRLSGGEKNILNICIRLAMTDLFPTDLRLLVLDEVEVHLDSTNVGRLPVLLERVKSVARSRDLVVVFVSHHPSLREVADRIISLAPGSP